MSGGQARRIGIARALVLNPRLVIADEPTAGLDVSIQGDLLNLMADLQEKFGLTYLMVSHNLNVVRKVTDRVAVMYLGKIVEIGRTRHGLRPPAHPYTHALISANPEIDPAKRREKMVLPGEIPSPLVATARLPLPYPLPARQNSAAASRSRSCVQSATSAPPPAISPWFQLDADFAQPAAEREAARVQRTAIVLLTPSDEPATLLEDNKELDCSCVEQDQT